MSEPYRGRFTETASFDRGRIIRKVEPIETCVVCGKPRYQKHAERCAGRPPYAIARDIVDGGAGDTWRSDPDVRARLEMLTAEWLAANPARDEEAFGGLVYDLLEEREFMRRQRVDVLRLARAYLATCGIRP